MEMLYTKKTMEELGRLDALTAKEQAQFPIYILLDDVRSMNNVGSVFRTADSMGVAGVYLCGYTPRPPHRDIHKTALGATETVTWFFEEDITQAITNLKAQGYAIYAVEQTHHSTWLQDFAVTKDVKIALIFGNEVTGVSDAALAMCDGVIEIPQFGAKHSLNISVTTGIVVWEVIRKML